MSTNFDLQQALTYAMKSRAISPDESARMLEWSKVNPEQLIGQPAALQQCLYWQDKAQKLVQSPLIQQAIHAAKTPALSVQKFVDPQVARSAINEAWGNYTLQGQATPQQRSVTPKQVPTLTQRGDVVTVNMTPLANQVQPAPGAWVDPQPVTKSAGETLTVPQIWPGVTGQVQRSYTRPEVVNGPFYRFIGRSRTTGNRRFRLITADDPVRPGEELFCKKSGVFDSMGIAAPQQPAQPSTQLPISPHTGQPSSITAAVRLTTLGEPQPALALHPYQQQQQAQYQALQQRATYENSLPVSPFTGQPSQIRAAILQTT